MQPYVRRIAEELSLRPQQVDAALELLGQGNTIPFVARYRKEATGELDEVQIRDVRDRAEYLSEMDERRGTILGSIEEQGKLTPELKAQVQAATTKS
ncbi:MAG: Tex-like N-terminal domain-containing protein, partial [Gemmatimonadota bacterium]